MEAKRNIGSLVFGTAGIPICTEERNTANGIRKVKELGLGVMELEFVHSVNISEEAAPLIDEVRKREEVELTCHAPYFINLNASEPQKLHASMARIEKSAEILGLCGGRSVCFHPGFYLKDTQEAAFGKVKDSIKEIRKRLDDKGIHVQIRPETTGKPTQFGDYLELLRISQEIEGVMPVFDFAHLHARTGGRFNTEAEFRQVLDDVEHYLGRDGLDDMHIHVSGINYGDKGEKNHLILDESDLNYKDLIRVWKEYSIKGTVISESPNIEEDALLMKAEYKD